MEAGLLEHAVRGFAEVWRHPQYPERLQSVKQTGESSKDALVAATIAAAPATLACFEFEFAAVDGWSQTFRAWRPGCPGLHKTSFICVAAFGWRAHGGGLLSLMQMPRRMPC